jgi:hypothetical protein
MLDADSAVEFAQHIMRRHPDRIYSDYQTLATPTRIAIAEILGDILKRKDTKTYMARLLFAQSAQPDYDIPGRLPEIIRVRAGPGELVVTLENPVLAEAGATLLGSFECDQYTFGFTQFVTYENLIVDYYNSNTRNYLVADYFGAPRKPCQDVFNDGDVWSYSERLACSSHGVIKSFGKDHVLSFEDTPKKPVALLTDMPQLTLTGISWFETFITAFSVMLPNGVVHHISWFDWQVDYCEKNPPIGRDPGSAMKTGQHVHVNSIRSGAPPSNVANLIGKPSGKSCNTIYRNAESQILTLSSPLVKCEKG